MLTASYEFGFEIVFEPEMFTTRQPYLDIIRNAEAIPALQALKEKGLIRAIGMSTKTVDGGLAAAPLVDVLMVTLNLDDRSQLPVIEAAADHGVEILLKKVFASGHRAAEESLGYVLGIPGVTAAVVGTISPEEAIGHRG